MPKKVQQGGDLFGCTGDKCGPLPSLPTQYYVDIPFNKFADSVVSKLKQLDDNITAAGMDGNYNESGRNTYILIKTKLLSYLEIIPEDDILIKIIYNTQFKNFYLNKSEISDNDKLFIKELLLPYIISITPPAKFLGFSSPERIKYLNIQKLLQVILDKSTYESISQKDNKYNITFYKTIENKKVKTVVSMEEHKEDAPAAAIAEEQQSLPGGGAKKVTKPKPKPSSAKKETKPKSKSASAKKETKSKTKKPTPAKPKAKKEKSTKI